jgi:hypothetical protein
MKLVAFVVLIAVGFIQAEASTTRASHPSTTTTTANPEKARFLASLEGLKTEYNQMRTSGTIDNAELIGKLQTMVTYTQAHVDRVPGAMRLLATSSVNDFRGKVIRMESSGRFDPKNFKTFKNISKYMTRSSHSY